MCATSNISLEIWHPASRRNTFTKQSFISFIAVAVTSSCGRRNFHSYLNTIILFCSIHCGIVNFKPYQKFISLSELDYGQTTKTNISIISVMVRKNECLRQLMSRAGF